MPLAPLWKKALSRAGGVAYIRALKVLEKVSFRAKSSLVLTS